MPHLPSRYQTSLSLKTQSKLLDILLSSLQAEIDSSTRSLDSGDPSAHLEHKTPLEMYAFLLQWFISGAEKAAAASAGAGEEGGSKKVRLTTHRERRRSC